MQIKRACTITADFENNNNTRLQTALLPGQILQRQQIALQS